MKFYISNGGEVFAYESDGSQDSEIKPGMVEMTAAEIEAHINPTLTDAEKIAAITASIQAVLDGEAQSRNYDNINAIGKYLGYDNAFRAECEALGSWTAQVWSKGYELLNTWQQTGVEITQQQVLDQLPIMGA